jgi:hypothetical protein
MLSGDRWEMSFIDGDAYSSSQKYAKECTNKKMKKVILTIVLVLLLNIVDPIQMRYVRRGLVVPQHLQSVREALFVLVES